MRTEVVPELRWETWDAVWVDASYLGLVLKVVPLPEPEPDLVVEVHPDGRETG